MAKCEWTGADCPTIISYGCWIRPYAEILSAKEKSLPEDSEEIDAVHDEFSWLSTYRCGLEKTRGRDIDNGELTPEEIKRFRSLRFQLTHVLKRLFTENA